MPGSRVPIGEKTRLGVDGGGVLARGGGRSRPNRIASGVGGQEQGTHVDGVAHSDECSRGRAAAQPLVECHGSTDGAEEPRATRPECRVRGPTADAPSHPRKGPEVGTAQSGMSLPDWSAPASLADYESRHGPAAPLLLAVGFRQLPVRRQAHRLATPGDYRHSFLDTTRHDQRLAHSLRIRVGVSFQRLTRLEIGGLPWLRPAPPLCSAPCFVCVGPCARAGRRGRRGRRARRAAPARSARRSARGCRPRTSWPTGRPRRVE